MLKISSRQTLAKILARLMERSPGLNSQNALGQKAKVAHSHIGRILRCESAATVDMLDSLASALGVEPWELLVDDGDMREAIIRRVLGNGASLSDDLPIPPKTKRKR